MKGAIRLSYSIAIIFTIALAAIIFVQQTKIIPLLFLVGLVVILFVISPTLFWAHEKKQYNNGVCPKCGHVLRHFDTCFCGDEGYRCDHCGNSFWLSWFSPTKRIKEDGK